MSVESLMAINNTYNEAVIFHREQADLFWFIYMAGYAMWHETQTVEEHFVQRRIKRYITSTYHILPPEKLPESESSIVELTKGLNRKKLKDDIVCNIIKQAFYKYMEFEEKNLKLYQQVAASLFDDGEISAFNFVGEIIADVKKELVYVTDKIIEFESMNWDMPQIVSEQKDYVERHEKLIREPLGKSKYYHHNNSNLDIESRTSLLNKYNGD